MTVGPAANCASKRLVTKADLAHMEQRLTIRLGGMMVVTVGVVATLVKIL